MNNKKTSMILLPLAALALSACVETSSSKENSSTSEASSSDGYDLKWVTPTSTPALAFYDQGNNVNWVSSSSPATVVVPAFGAGTFDAIVFDGVSGLNLIKKNNYDYKMASWISGGNFYVVSTKHTSKTEFAAGQTITGFVKAGNAAQTFLKLSKDQWGWNYADSDIEFLEGVAQIQSAILSNDQARDYWIIADPIYTAVKAALAEKQVTLHVISDLQADFKTAYGLGTIPAAALFVKGSAYAAHQGVFDRFVSETQARVDDSVEDVEKVVSAIAAYGDDTAAKERFGFTSAMVTANQGNGANKFAMLKTGEVTDVKAFANGFASVILGSTFDDSFFVS